MHILGISAWSPDASAALVRDGEVLAAAHEERFTRIKHDPAMPLRAGRWCLAEAGIDVRDLDWLVFYEKPLRKFVRVLNTAVATFPRGWRGFSDTMQLWLGDRLWARNQLARAFGVAPERILFGEHHRSHAASAFYPSPHAEAAVLCADGVGESACTSIWRGRGDALDLCEEADYPHSLGLFGAAFATWAGLPARGAEVAMSAMARHGSPVHADALRKVLRVQADGSFDLDMDWFAWHWHPTRAWSPRLADAFGAPRVPGAPLETRVADVVASAVTVVEEAGVALAVRAHTQVGGDALCLAGDLAAFPGVVRAIAERGPFRHIWVQPATGDGGGALGAALDAAHRLFGAPRRASDRLDLGRRFTRDEVASVLTDLGMPGEAVDDAAGRAASDLADGRIVAWFEGRDDWGARALGHRCILANSRDEARLRAVKSRETWRGFSKAVLGGDVPEAAAAPARAMLVAARDGSTPHVVDARSPIHPVVAQLPEILTTSLNLAGDPIVASPLDAVAAMLRADIDVLYIDGLRVERKTPWAMPQAVG